MKEIFIDDILKYRQIRSSHSDYRFGGWYLIVNTKNNKSYVGKSIEYMARLKQHLKIKNPKTIIDNQIKDNGINSFRFFLIKKYSEMNIHFHNRKLETIIEHTYINKLNTNYPNGYNIAYYEHLSVKQNLV